MVGEPNPTISHKTKNAKTPGIEDSRFLLDVGIEEGRAVSKSTHYKFGYFLSVSQQGVSAGIIQNSAVHIL
jgi:hypothetical protein